MDTNGTIKPGQLYSADLAAELTITQNWVAVMEAYWVSRGATKFSGYPGRDETGKLAKVGSGNFDELSFAPAVEFNFSENYGIIAGIWFSQLGKDAPDFSSTVVAFNAYW